MNKRLLTLAASVACLMATGCTSRHLVFTTYTRVGINMTAAGEVPTNLGLGYKRFEGLIIPVDPSKADPAKPNLPSVRASLKFHNRWFKGLDLEQDFATGEAAAKE